MSTTTLIAPRFENTDAIGWEDTDAIGWDQAIDLTVKNPVYAWLFDIDDGTYRWSTQAITVDDNDYTAAIDPESFNGVKIADNYNGAERIHIVENLELEVWDTEDAFVSSSFIGYDVVVHAWFNDGSASGVIRKFKLVIVSAKKIYNVLYLTLQDAFAYYELDKYFPNKENIDQIWKSTGDSDLDYVFPVPFGTPYIPLPCVYVDEAKTYTADTISIDAETNTISDSANGLDIFRNSNSVTISGAANSENNGTFIVVGMSSLSGTNLVLSSEHTLTDESAGASITVSQGQRFYVLGETGETYTINKVRAPEGWPRTVWDSDDYTFDQETQDGYRVFQAIIHDADDDGTVDSNGLFRDGGRFSPILTQYNRSDTSALTNPAEILSDLVFSGSTIPVDSSPYDLDIEFNGAFTQLKQKYEWASKILKAANAALIITADGNRAVKSLLTTPRAELTTAAVFEGTFSYDPVFDRDPYDGGYIKFPEDGGPQNKTYKYKVALNNISSTNPTSDALDLTFVYDSADAQKMGVLWLERIIDKKADVSCEAIASQINRDPDEVVSVSGDDYDATTSFDAICRSIHITPDMTVNLECDEFSHDLSLYADLTASELTIAEDDTRKFWIKDPEYTRSWVTVSPNVWEGEYSSITDAINSINANRGGLYLKDGTYTLDNPIPCPDFNLSIYGESRDGVIIQSPVNGRIFERTTTTDKIFDFKNVTFESRTGSTGYHMIHMEEGAWDLKVENCKFDLWDDGSINSDGDIGIYVRGDGGSTISVTDCIFNGGKAGADIEDVGAAKIKDNIFIAQTRVSVEVSDLSSFLFSDNKVYDFVYMGVLDSTSTNISSPGASFPSIPSSQITGNEIYSKNDSASGNLYGISIAGIDSIIFNNKVVIKNTRNGADTIRAIRVTTNISKGLISNNSVEIESDITSSCYGVIIVGTSQAGITANNINADASSADVYGLFLGLNLSAVHCERNNISNNIIDLANNTADEIGIYLSGESDNNYGDGNITYNCGTSVDDNGTGNNVTAQDV